MLILAIVFLLALYTALAMWIGYRWGAQAVADAKSGAAFARQTIDRIAGFSDVEFAGWKERYAAAKRVYGK